MVATPAATATASQPGMRSTSREALRTSSRSKGNINDQGEIYEQPHPKSATCNDQLDFERHDGRTPVVVFARIAQQLPALAAVIWRNRCIDAPVKRCLAAYDH